MSSESIRFSSPRYYLSVGIFGEGATKIDFSINEFYDLFSSDLGIRERSMINESDTSREHR